MKNVSSYFPIRTIQTSTCLEFSTMNEFCQFTKAHQLLDIFLLLNEANEPEYFGIIHNHVLFRHATLGFKTLEDYNKATQSKFPDASLYYEAAAQDYHSYEDYRLVKEAGISDKEVFNKIKSAHFISGFEDYKALLQSGSHLPLLPEFSNPYQLYTYAAGNEFADYHQFKKAIGQGFTNAIVYKAATEYGFPSSGDYNEGLQKGFRTFADLQLAREKGMQNLDDLTRFRDLEVLHCDNCFHDQKVLLTLLSKVEQGKKISINKLKELFKNMVAGYRYADTQQMPAWFTTSLDTDDAIIQFLQQNEQAKKFGTYDTDGEFFEISRMQERSVVIDGSNVAHNSTGSASSKPVVANIIKVVEHLKEEGFTDITVIADASLKHRLLDGNKLPQLKQMVEYLEAPRETPADIFLIRYVKSNHCLLVSNDTFREWKIQDTWTAENIDFYRLSFMIKGEQVLMPDLDLK